MSTQLHILNASGSLSRLIPSIELACLSALSQIESLIPVGSVDVLVSDRPSSTIPEYSIGGYSPRAGIAEIFLDAGDPDIESKLNKHLLCVLGHELHHCARWRSVGDGKTLGEAIVSEGLACAFEGELAAGFQPFYARALNDQAFQDCVLQVGRDWDRADYDHAAWFYGTAHLPRHAGYAIGYEIVSRHIRKTGQPASKLVDVCAGEIRGAPH